MERLWELLWHWMKLVEQRLMLRAGDGDMEERARLIAEMQAALFALGIAVPTVEELRERWADDEMRGRARVTGVSPERDEEL